MSLVPKEASGGVFFSPEQVEVIKRTICKSATDDELSLFLIQCKRTGLDPFSRQIWAVKRWDSKEGREVMSIQTSIDGFRLIADRTGKYEGQVGPWWCGKDMKWLDIWPHDEPPFACKVGVLRSGFKELVYGLAKFWSFAQTVKGGALNPFWARMPDHMIAKVAESLALRKAFPNDLSGLYTTEEMASAIDADRDKRPTNIDVTPVQKVQQIDSTPIEIEDAPPLPKPKGYDGSPAHQEALIKALELKKIPQGHWDAIAEAMMGRTYNDLPSIIDQMTNPPEPELF
jgi:phage recombination protein Bet